MSDKIKINSLDKISETAKNAGLVLMATAATVGLIEHSDSHEKRAILGQQPIYAFAGELQGASDMNMQRRERDDIGPHYISYSVAQRTPGRTGKW